MCWHKSPAVVIGLAAFSWATFAAVAPEAAAEAEHELFAARYKKAAELYANLLQQDPDWAPGYYGLVSALIEDHRSREAYKAAGEGLLRLPNAAETLTAVGLAAYRRGDIFKAEEYFNKARQVKPQYPGALVGVGRLSYCVSRFKTARELRLAAFQQSPNDPDLIVTWAGTLKGADRIIALQKALAIYDPASHEARGLRNRIASEKSVHDRKLFQLTSPNQQYKIKLVQIMQDARRVRGLGLNVKVNGRQTVRLLLDTGASGISIAPKAAEKAELESMTTEASEVRGIGDSKPLDSNRFMASSIEIGGLTFSNVMISAFRAAKDSDIDGLIGADVFSRFLITIDFPRNELTLDPQTGEAPTYDEPQDAPPLPAGFFRAPRVGTHLMLLTNVNDSPRHLFLMDSGSSVNLIDKDLAAEVTKVRGDDRTILRGVQGRVKDVASADRIVLTFAGFRQDNPNLISLDMEKQGDGFGTALGGIIGMPVLWNLKVTIDYRAGAVRLVRGR
jgi:tetratricopeptide (TPR) repeat protein